MTETLAAFRMIGGEFAHISDSDVEGYIKLFAPLVGKKPFGNVYHLALAYFIAHKLKLMGKGEQGALADSGFGLGDLMQVSSISEGAVSISSGVSGGALSAAADGELGLTEYGLQFMSLRRYKVINIVSAGENV